MNRNRIIILVLFGAAVLAMLASGFGDYLTLANFKASQASVNAYHDAHPVSSRLLYMSIYISLTALSLPAAGVLTLAAGAVFGFLWGLVLASLSSTLGATCAFLLARYLFRDAVQSRYADRLARINAGISNDGALYLFMLRMIPVFPFFIINATMALTPIRTPVFFLVSMIGMLPITAIMVNAGLQISKISTPGDILSPSLLFSLGLIGIFPLLVKKSVQLYKRAKYPSSIE
jgi:uncharacterized membrane protein YdjX (TVP38/TMEM64 family)